MENETELFEAESGGLLAALDALCSVSEKLIGIVREQAVLIKQGKVAGMAFPQGIEERRADAEDDLDKIEMKLRRTR